MNTVNTVPEFPHEFLALPGYEFLGPIYKENHDHALVAVRQVFQDLFPGVRVEVDRTHNPQASRALNAAATRLGSRRASIGRVWTWVGDGQEYLVMTVQEVLTGLLRKHPFTDKPITDMTSPYYTMDIVDFFLFNFVIRTEMNRDGLIQMGSFFQEQALQSFLDNPKLKANAKQRILNSGGASSVAAGNDYSTQVKQAQNAIWFNDANASEETVAPVQREYIWTVKLHGSLEPAVNQTLSAALRKLECFWSDAEVRTLFDDARLSPWASRVPNAGSLDFRVSAVISLMLNGMNTHDKPALELLLELLLEKYPGEGALNPIRAWLT